MSWICFVCDEIFYDEAYPWGDVFCCASCHAELEGVREEDITDEKRVIADDNQDEPADVGESEE